MAVEMHITLRRNEDYVRQWRVISGPDRQPVDLTGCTVQMQVKTRLDNGNVLASATCIVSDAPGGIVDIDLRASEGTPLGSYGDQLQSYRLPYDVRAVASDGRKRVLFFGEIVLDRGVTRYA